MANGMGGLDWSALPLAAEMYGISNIETLVTRLMVIKTHRPNKEDD